MTSERRFYDKPVLAVLFTDGKLPRDKEYYASYRGLFRLLQRRFSIFTVSPATYCGKGRFKKGNYWNGNTLIPHKTHIVPAIVFNKGEWWGKGGQDWKVINRPGLRRICRHKDVTRATFPHLFKFGKRVRSKEECRRILARISTPLAVFKPRDGQEGKGVVVARKGAMLKRLTQYDGILEEYIDSGGGIPGIVKGTHDLRITVMDGKIVHGYVRVPRSGSRLANIAQGGSVIEYTLSHIPLQARKVKEQIDWTLARFGRRVYSIDLAFEGKTPYLYELNDQPAMPSPYWRIYQKWHRALMHVFISCIKDLGTGSQLGG